MTQALAEKPIATMWILAAYLLGGILICAVVAARGSKSGQRSEFPFAMLFDPIWPLVFLWPLWLAILLVERTFLRDSAKPSSTPPNPIGQSAIVVSILRPVGRIRMDSEYFDARSDGRIIPEGTVVRIVSRSMGEYLVEETLNKQQ